MSYDTMDHVGWVERNIAASIGHKPSAANLRRKAKGMGWFAAPERLNPFQRRVFTLLGIIGGGIYNAPIEWDSICWGGRYISLNWRHEMATWDSSALTSAVLLAHDAAVRLAISPRMRWLELAFHEREPRTDGMGYPQGLPTLDQTIAKHRSRFPAGHPIHFTQTSEPRP